MKMFVILVLTLMISVSCTTREVYLDQGSETPRGAVPPPPKARTINTTIDATALPEVRPMYQAPVKNVQQKNQQQEQQREQEKPSREERSEGTVDQFRNAYRNTGNPRIAVYVNQELSDEVREWTGPTKFLVGQKESASPTSIAKRKTMALGVDTNEVATRSSPNEAWVWDFENGFMNPFLSAGTQLVDRAMIMRLSALKAKKPGSTFQGSRKRTIEMDALLDFADIFVEVLITKAPASPLGYEIKAIAKEVRTGVILAHASSTRWSTQLEQKEEPEQITQAVPTATGYKMVTITKEKEQEFPTGAEVSNDLAIEVMNALMRSWG